MRSLRWSVGLNVDSDESDSVPAISPICMARERMVSVDSNGGSYSMGVLFEALRYYRHYFTAIGGKTAKNVGIVPRWQSGTICCSAVCRNRQGTVCRKEGKPSRFRLLRTGACGMRMHGACECAGRAGARGVLMHGACCAGSAPAPGEPLLPRKLTPLRRTPRRAAVPLLFRCRRGSPLRRWARRAGRSTSCIRPAGRP